MTEHELRTALEALETEAAGEPFTQAQKNRWNDINAALDEYATRRSRLLELSRDPRRIEHERSELPYRRGSFDDAAPAHVRAAHDSGLRAIARHERALSARAADHLDALVREADPVGIGSSYLDAVGDPAYASAFGKMVMDPLHGHLRFTPEETAAVQHVSAVESQRAMSIGTGSAGGFAVPFELDPSIMLTGSGALNPLRQIARVVTVTHREWRGVASDGVVAAYSAEATEASDNSPTLVQPVIDTWKWQAFVPFSIELGEDWATLQTELGRLFADARDVNDATQFLTGAGTSGPGGILNIAGTGGLTTTQRVQTATVATFVVGDPWLLKAGLAQRFIPTSTFAAAPATWDSIYRFVAQGSTTEPRQFSDGDRGGDFLGRPKVEWSTMGTGTATGTKLLIAGDFSGYTIVDRLGISIELVPILMGPANRFPTGQRGLFAYGRTGGGVTMPNALRYLEVK